jgi:hypothetical protein
MAALLPPFDLITPVAHEVIPNSHGGPPGLCRPTDAR